MVFIGNNQYINIKTQFMKKIILFSAVLFALLACNKEVGYTIKGVITGQNEALKSGKIYLSNRDSQAPIRDTADIVDGKFTFKGSIVSPEFFFITIDGMDGRIPIFLENEKYQITAVDSVLYDASIVGGKTQAIFTKANLASKELELKYDLENLMKEYRLAETTQERKDSIVAIYDRFSAEAEAITNKIVKENPLSHYSLYKFKQDVEEMNIDSATVEIEKYKAIEEFKTNKEIVYIEQIISKNKQLQPGMPCFDFTMKDPEGNVITLSDIYKKNKVTMIDFWAGWCGPCRHFNPSLVKIYDQFHKKGFEVLGVSLDKERDSWLNAIKSDKLTWPQVSDVNYWDCEAVKLYNVKYIPQNVFVDQSGFIIGRKVAEQDIPAFLEEHLK